MKSAMNLLGRKISPVAAATLLAVAATATDAKEPAVTEEVLGGFAKNWWRILPANEGSALIRWLNVP